MAKLVKVASPTKKVAKKVKKTIKKDV